MHVNHRLLTLANNHLVFTVLFVRETDIAGSASLCQREGKFLETGCLTYAGISGALWSGSSLAGGWEGEGDVGSRKAGRGGRGGRGAGGFLLLS